LLGFHNFLGESFKADGSSDGDDGVIVVVTVVVDHNGLAFEVPSALSLDFGTEIRSGLSVDVKGESHLDNRSLKCEGHATHGVPVTPAAHLSISEGLLLEVGFHVLDLVERFFGGVTLDVVASLGAEGLMLGNSTKGVFFSGSEVGADSCEEAVSISFNGDKVGTHFEALTQLSLHGRAEEVLLEGHSILIGDVGTVFFGVTEAFSELCNSSFGGVLHVNDLIRL
jgi:hypothetical protein